MSIRPVDPTLISRVRSRARAPRPAGARHAASVLVVRDPAALSAYVPAWQDLAVHALEANVFYEPWMLLPALKAYGTGEDVRVALVFARDPRNPAAPQKLVGLFPLQWRGRFGRLHVTSARLWQYAHCYLCTPLVRADGAAACLSAIFQWLRSGEAGASLMELQCIAGDGPFRQQLVDVANALGLTCWVTEIYTRGLWRAAAANGAARLPVSGNLRRRLQRKDRRLSERGGLEHVCMQAGDDLARWTDDFLQVEASGWKGRLGSALACTEAGRRYFAEVAAAAFRRGRLLMQGLDFERRPIARRCAFIAGDGAFAFKTAYDERYAHYSPGAMLELDSLRQLAALPAVRWMDFCATPGNALVNRIANGRRTIQSIAVGGGMLGELLVAGLPLMRWTRRRLRHKGAAAPVTTF